VKFRFFILALAAVALLSGCGSSTDSVNVDGIDSAAPAPPAKMYTDIDARLHRASLRWDASTSSNVSGYQVYYYAPNPLREESYDLYRSTEASVRSVQMPYSAEAQTVYVMVRAVGRSGNPGAFTGIYQMDIPASSYDDPS